MRQVLILCLLATTGMGSSGMARPADADGPAPAPPAVTWTACVDVIGVPLDLAVADCARVDLPLDHAGRVPGRTSLAMLRRKATDTEHRIGSLFINPGGPGASGLHLAYRAERLLPPPVVARYDIIGFDPRGVGQSDAVRCFRSQEEYQAAFADRVPAPLTPGDIDGTLHAYRTYTTACASNAGPMLPYVSTASVARDLDLIRRAIGESRLNLIGLSYGTLIAATYRNMFPDHTGAMVLDGNTDPRLRARDGLEYDRRRALGMESALDAFLHACATAPSCAFGGGDPHTRLAAIRHRLRAGPVDLGDGDAVTFSSWVGRLADGLADAAGLPELARSLAALHDVVQAETGIGTAGRHSGPASPSRAGAAYFGTARVAAKRRFADTPDETANTAGGASVIGTTESPYRLDDSEYAVNCLDKPYPRRPHTLPALADRWEHQAPTFGRLLAFDGAPCATWPALWWSVDRYTGPWNATTAQDPLVIGNRNDPVTGFAFAQRMAAELGRARLVAVDMFGHTALGLNRCVTAVVAAYLIDGLLPPPVRECPADAPPFPPAGPAVAPPM